MAGENSESTENSTPVAGAANNSSGGGNTIVVILTLVNLVVTLGMLAITFISFQREKQRPSIEDIAAKAAGEGEGEKPKEGEHAAKEGKEGKEGEGKGGEKKKTTDFGKMVTLDQFTVNLSTPGSVGSKYVRVNISLEVPTEDAEAEVNSKVPQVRNTIIDLFNSKRPADLANAEGRDYLKEEIRNALNSFLVTGKVKAVYFTNFALAG